MRQKNWHAALKELCMTSDNVIRRGEKKRREHWRILYSSFFGDTRINKGQSMLYKRRIQSVPRLQSERR